MLGVEGEKTKPPANSSFESSHDHFKAVGFLHIDTYRLVMQTSRRR